MTMYFESKFSSQEVAIYIIDTNYNMELSAAKSMIDLT